MSSCQLDRGSEEVYASEFCLDDECWRLYEQKVHNVLTEGLSDIVQLVHVIWRNTPSECIIENGFSTFNSEPLLIGVSVSSLEKAFRALYVGPSTESKAEVLKFRKFWGEKVELRIFKDGSTTESTVWEWEQLKIHLIIKRIVEYVLLQHLSLPTEKIMLIVDQLDFCLLHGAEGNDSTHYLLLVFLISFETLHLLEVFFIGYNNMNFSDPISFSGSLIEAFETLSKHLCLIEDIPLQVSTVHALDSDIFHLLKCYSIFFKASL